MAWGISQLFILTVGPSECAEELAPIVQKLKMHICIESLENTEKHKKQN